jgi:hypothetical protein
MGIVREIVRQSPRVYRVIVKATISFDSTLVGIWVEQSRIRSRFLIKESMDMVNSGSAAIEKAQRAERSLHCVPAIECGATLQPKKMQLFVVRVTISSLFSNHHIRMASSLFCYLYTRGSWRISWCHCEPNR